MHIDSHLIYKLFENSQQKTRRVYRSTGGETAFSIIGDDNHTKYIELNSMSTHWAVDAPFDLVIKKLLEFKTLQEIGTRLCTNPENGPGWATFMAWIRSPECRKDVLKWRARERSKQENPDDAHLYDL